MPPVVSHADSFRSAAGRLARSPPLCALVALGPVLSATVSRADSFRSASGRLARRQRLSRVRSSRAPTASVARPVVSRALVSAVCACCTTQSPGLRCVHLLHDSVAWWLILRSRAALVSAATLPQCRSVPRARELHWNSAALVSSTLVVIKF